MVPAYKSPTGITKYQVRFFSATKKLDFMNSNTENLFKRQPAPRLGRIGRSFSDSVVTQTANNTANYLWLKVKNHIFSSNK